MKPVVPAADAQLGVGAGGKWSGVFYNGMWVTTLLRAEAQIRSAGATELRLRFGVKPVCGMTVYSVARPEWMGVRWGRFGSPRPWRSGLCPLKPHLQKGLGRPRAVEENS